jgi:hypothetical protein
LITAEEGTLRKRIYFRSRCDAIKDLRMVTLPGHHHLHLDDPAPVAAVVSRFLDEHKANRPMKHQSDTMLISGSGGTDG